MQRSDFQWWTREKLRNADTDQYVHVNNAVLCTFLEAGRMEVFAQLREQIEQMRGANPAIVHLEVDFHQQMHYPGHVDIGTRVLSLGTSSLRFAQGLFVGDACVASAQAVCVLLDPGTGRAQPLSDALRKVLA